MFLVDGSINFGRNNFNEVMSFISNLIDLFFTERDDLRFGLAHYTADVNDVFYLNTYKNREEIVDAISRADYKGGNKINTGAAIRHVQNVHFTKERGSRADEGTPQILMVITGGPSADDSKSAALGLKQRGVRVFAVGVGDIQTELENLASESTTVARASTIQELSELNEQILETLDDEVKGKLCTGTADTTKSKGHIIMFSCQWILYLKYFTFRFAIVSNSCFLWITKVKLCSVLQSVTWRCWWALMLMRRTSSVLRPTSRARWGLFCRESPKWQLSVAHLGRFPLSKWACWPWTLPPNLSSWISQTMLMSSLRPSELCGLVDPLSLMARPYQLIPIG